MPQPCEMCGGEIKIGWAYPLTKGSVRRFCGKTCSAKWRRLFNQKPCKMPFGQLKCEKCGENTWHLARQHLCYLCFCKPLVAQFEANRVKEWLSSRKDVARRRLPHSCLECAGPIDVDARTGEKSSLQQRFCNKICKGRFAKRTNEVSREEKTCSDCGERNLTAGYKIRCLDCTTNYHNEKRKTDIRCLYRDYKRQADKRRLNELSFEEFQSFWQKPCLTCGQDIATLGIDRWDNEKSYTLENCVPMCFVCNKIFGILDKNKALAHIKHMAQQAIHLQSRPYPIQEAKDKCFKKREANIAGPTR